MMYWTRHSIGVITLLLVVPLTDATSSETTSSETTSSEKNRVAAKNVAPDFSIVVMDPLAAPLSCPCVEGYAQRKYEVLAAYLERTLKRRVTLQFAGSLEKTGQAVQMVIGKDSVVRADARKYGLKVVPVASLTGKNGATTQRGLFVVRSWDPARNVADLADYHLIVGPEEAAEKHAAVKALLLQLHVRPAGIEISDACSDGACRVVESDRNARMAAVISSYAQPLVEGCGTVKKGALRVVGETEEVPFITAFASAEMTEVERQLVRKALLAVGDEPELCDALETLVGFVAYDETATPNDPTSMESTTVRGKKNE